MRTFLFTLLLTLLTSPAIAENECVFDEGGYKTFVSGYKSPIKPAKVSKTEKSLSIHRNHEQILVEGGGCNHLGMSIELHSNQTFNEEQFLNKALELTKEFGGWLLNIKTVEQAFKTNKFQKIDNIYYFNIDMMTVFNTYIDKDGNIIVEFYIN